MSWLAEPFTREVPEEEDDWGSDFEGELCSQEIEDNKINEIREANLLKSSPNNAQDLTEDNSQTFHSTTGNSRVNATKTGAIPKTGFSYLNNTAILDAGRSVQTAGIETRNKVHPQRQVPQLSPQSRNTSMNFQNSGGHTHIQVSTTDDAVTKKTPRKLKPEAFSFLNNLPQKNITENGIDVIKERKTLVPTAFSHAEKLGFSQPHDETSMTPNENSDEFINAIPSAPPLGNTTSNYETIPEDSFSEFTIQPESIVVGKENVKPPLPSRPPPVFKYPPETFSSSKPTCTEPTGNVAISQSFPQSAPIYPKLGHSISSPDSGLKYSNEAMQDQILNSKEKNRRSLPSAAIYPAIPKRPLPPLPISSTENFNKIKPPARISKLESPVSLNDGKLIEETPTIHRTISNSQTSQLPISEAPIHQTVFKEPLLQDQLISNPQHRLAQILTNQTSVDGSILLSQQKIASAISSRAAGSQNNASRLHVTDESEFQNGGRSQKLVRVLPERSLENGSEQTYEDELERMPSCLEAKEPANPRRFPDPETLINAINRPALPQKAAPIQRSVSCNSLVQSIKDLSFSVWSKPEKKRNSDGISLSKKNTRSISVAGSSKAKCTAPLSITVVTPTDAPSEVNNPDYGIYDVSHLDEERTLQEYPWFHDVDAKEGQLRLQSVGQDGTFLVRPSSRPTEDIQNTLCILYNRKIRNLHIRRTADDRYVLGTKSSKNFSSIDELIRHHKEVPVEILPQGSTPIKPQLYRILLRETPSKVQKQFTY